MFCLTIVITSFLEIKQSYNILISCANPNLGKFINVKVSPKPIKLQDLSSSISPEVMNKLFYDHLHTCRSLRWKEIEFAKLNRFCNNFSGIPGYGQNPQRYLTTDSLALEIAVIDSLGHLLRSISVTFFVIIILPANQIASLFHQHCLQK